MEKVSSWEWLFTLFPAVLYIKEFATITNGKVVSGWLERNLSSLCISSTD